MYKAKSADIIRINYHGKGCATYLKSEEISPLGFFP